MDEIAATLTYPLVPVAVPSSQEKIQSRRSPGVSDRRSDASSSTSSDSTPRDEVSLSREAQELAKLARRDREVRAHEAAHAAMGGPYAAAPSFTYTRGPDGTQYATGGEVSIDVSPVPGDPEATLQKAQIIRAAALAPAQPSSADRLIAAKASRMSIEARSEIQAQTSVFASDSSFIPETGPVETPATRQAVLRTYGPSQTDPISLPSPGSLLNFLA
ncbi:putative metalloprotease CJM1_0395 family protein [Desulfuromonas sp. AOP6]|uniref:putative metalloprotease CJM1_0395 family protein n=1 Tax=Desulfuromonas sp. AOP6 TaxID=1566351 RepID=UPI001282EB98|nr:putative metalloprotease CJM1_0395 family protein [Desulfuromonas sp. AOP6]